MRLKGNMGEMQAIRFLNDNQFDILCRNFYTRFGEIDIIAKKKTIHSYH